MVDDGTDKREGGFEPDVSIFVKTVFLTCCVEEIEEEGIISAADECFPLEN